MSVRLDVKSDKPRKKSTQQRLEEKRLEERKERDNKRETLQGELSDAQRAERYEATTKILSEEKELKLDDACEIAERILQDELVLRQSPLAPRNFRINVHMGMYRLAVRLVPKDVWECNAAKKWADDMAQKESTMELVRKAKAYLEENPTKKGRYQ